MVPPSGGFSRLNSSTTARMIEMPMPPSPSLISGIALAVGAVDVVLVEARAFVADADDHAVVVHREGEVHLAVVVVVGVAHGVGARLGEGQLEVGDRVVRVAAAAQQPGERQPPEHDVLGLRRDIEVDEFFHSAESYRSCHPPDHPRVT